MVVQLENKDIHYVNTLEDIKEIVEPAIAEAIEDIIICDYEDEESYKTEIKDLEEWIDRLKDQLEESKHLVMEANAELRNNRDLIWSLQNMNDDYKKSKSKRVDKEALIFNLTLMISKFKNIRSV